MAGQRFRLGLQRFERCFGWSDHSLVEYGLHFMRALGTNGALAVKGLWLEKKVSINLINVYAPNVSKGQQKLWDELHKWIIDNTDVPWCVCGDFNSILVKSEGKGVGRYSDVRRSRQFNRFISDTDLVDLPLLRRKFTWYKDNGDSCSRIDRFPLSTSWFTRWPNAKQTGLRRTFSDHAPILLEVTEKEN
ncbi:hypothetical protein ACS0TY_018812 [Phlomoides rotata]